MKSLLKRREQKIFKEYNEFSGIPCTLRTWTISVKDVVSRCYAKLGGQKWSVATFWGVGDQVYLAYSMQMPTC